MKKPGRVVRVEIVVDAEDTEGDGHLNECLLALGGALCDMGHSNVMRAELITPRVEERKEEVTKQVDPSLN